MIRNVVMGRLRVDADGVVDPAAREEVAGGIAGILALDLPGQLSMSGGLDAGIREGGWDFAITNDWQDAAAYHGYDADPEHNRLRQIIAGGSAQLARVQFEI